ncbi:hypothetical protein [Dongshaea marina]|uniref:hypothetical protein n=1 Tax=Dongshaea marina TaxID=2047966 RepID=UPI000D3E3CBD|nr:hypothetical protein [Dongshaea marina]
MKRFNFILCVAFILGWLATPSISFAQDYTNKMYVGCFQKGKNFDLSHPIPCRDGSPEGIKSVEGTWHTSGTSRSATTELTMLLPVGGRAGIGLFDNDTEVTSVSASVTFESGWTALVDKRTYANRRFYFVWSDAGGAPCWQMMRFNYKQEPYDYSGCIIYF